MTKIRNGLALEEYKIPDDEPLIQMAINTKN